MINNIKVIIVDDHPMIRAGLKSTLEKISGITVPGEAETGEELLKKAQNNRYDIILLDLNLTDKSGLEILDHLKTSGINTPVLVFSVNPEKEYALRAIKAGARGYIHKQSGAIEIASAIKKIAAGQTYMSDTVQELLRMHLVSGKKNEDLLHRALSTREFDVMLHISRGLSNKEIAGRLNISGKTVSTFLSRIYEKLGIFSRAELTKYVIKNKLEPVE